MKFETKSFSNLFLHPDCRWDSEYLCFEPYRNTALEYAPIGEVITSSQYGVSIDMNEEGVGTKIYRMNEIANILCDQNVSKYASLEPKDIAKYRLQDRDVLFNRTNSQVFVGRTGLYRQFSGEDIVFASYLIRITSNSQKVTPEYLTAFLNTRHGLLDIQRRARISINQSNVNAEELKRVEIPLLSHAIQSVITSVFNQAFEMVHTAGELYTEAQAVLLSELGLIDWQLDHQPTFVKKFSDVWGAGRIDADYFQPGYEKVVSSIQGYVGGTGALEDLVTLKAETFNPEYGAEYRYIELANIGTSGEVTGCMIGLGTGTAQQGKAPRNYRRCYRIFGGRVVAQRCFNRRGL